MSLILGLVLIAVLFMFLSVSITLARVINILEAAERRYFEGRALDDGYEIPTRR